MPIAAGVSAGGSLISGLFGGKAATSAANTQAAAEKNVASIAQSAVQAGQGDVTAATNTGTNQIANATAAGTSGIASGTQGALQTLANAAPNVTSAYSPYTSAGAGALPALSNLATGTNSPLTQQFSFNPNNLTANPGYEFTLQQGQQAIQKAAAAGGSLFSSGTLKSLANYTTGTANQYFNTAYNQALSTFQANQQQGLAQAGILQNLAGGGLTASSGQANLLTGLANTSAGLQQQGSQAGATLGLTGAQAGANLGLGGAENVSGTGIQGAGIVGNALTGAANAQAAGTIGSTNAYTQGLTGATNSISGYLGLSQLANLYPSTATQLNAAGITPAGVVPAYPAGQAPIPSP